MIFTSLNWNIEVFVYLIASIIQILSILSISYEFKRSKNKFHLYLMISWIILFFYIFLGGIAQLIQSKNLFVFEILLLIPSAFFLILVFDKLTLSSLDPIKMIIFGFFSSGIIINSFKSDAAISIFLQNGTLSYQTNGTFHIWISIFTGLVGSLYFYYCILIFIRSPPNLKYRAFITLLGGIFFNIVAFTLYITRLTKVIPGIMLVSLAIGTFLTSFSFYLEPHLLDVLIRSESEAKLKKLMKILPICSKCKKIRDESDIWHPIEDFLSTNAEILFSHGFCPDCYKEEYSDL